MKKKLMTTAILAMTLATTGAQNPIVQTWYTSDPAPMVYGDKI